MMIKKKIKGFINLRFVVSSLKSRTGVTVAAAMIVVFVLASFGAGITYFVASSTSTRLQQIQGDQAFYAVETGLEFALRQIIVAGTSETSITREFVGETITITRSSNRVYVSSSATSAASAHSIMDPDPPGPSDCLLVDVVSAVVSPNTVLKNIYLSRDPSCSEPIVIVSMSQTTWQPDDWSELYQIRIGGNPIEFSGPSATSGGNFVFQNQYTIDDGNQHTVNRMRFSGNMASRNFQLHFNYTYDGSNYTKIADVNFLADDQAACFEWNTSNAILKWTWGEWLRLIDTTVTNTCSTDPIRIIEATISLDPSTPSRVIDDIRIDGTSHWGPVTTGNPLAVDQIINASTTLDVDRITFTEEVLGRNYSIVWKFADDTTKVTTLDLFASNEHNCLNIDTTNAAIGSNDKQVIGITIENTCGADIGMVNLSMSWTGEASRRLTKIKANDTRGSHTYWGNAASGVPIDFAEPDLYLPNGEGSKDIDYLQFNNSIVSGTEFTLTFTMADGNTKSAIFTVTEATEADCLSVSTSATDYNNNSTRLRKIDLTNTCGSNIRWDETNISWTPLTPARQMNRIRFDGSNIYTGPAVNSGVTVNNTNATIGGGQTDRINYIRFNSSMSGRTYTIQFIMRDASVKTIGPFSP